jgi:hypothetical protein
MHSDALYFSILLCIKPDDSTRQVESAVTQRVKVVFMLLLDIIILLLFI